MDSPLWLAIGCLLLLLAFLIVVYALRPDLLAHAPSGVADDPTGPEYEGGPTMRTGGPRGGWGTPPAETVGPTPSASFVPPTTDLDGPDHGYARGSSSGGYPRQAVSWSAAGGARVTHMALFADGPDPDDDDDDDARWTVPVRGSSWRSEVDLERERATRETRDAEDYRAGQAAAPLMVRAPRDAVDRIEVLSDPAGRGLVIIPDALQFD